MSVGSTVISCVVCVDLLWAESMEIYIKMEREVLIIYNETTQVVKFKCLTDIYNLCYNFVEFDCFELQYLHENKNCVVLSEEMLDFALAVASPLSLTVVQRQQGAGGIGTRPRMRVLMLGLDMAGKTSLLYKWKLNEFVTAIPTIGFNVETIDMYDISFDIWDVGGQDKIRPLWRHYYEGL